MANKSNKHIVDDQEILRFNLMRENLLGKEFSAKEMKQHLKDKMGYKSGDETLRALSDGVNPPIIKVRRGVYAVNPKPVYKNRLQTAMDIKTKHTYTPKSKVDMTVEEAINLLKGKGYKIYVPLVEYKEV